MYEIVIPHQYISCTILSLSFSKRKAMSFPMFLKSLCWKVAKFFSSISWGVIEQPRETTAGKMTYKLRSHIEALRIIILFILC